MALHVLGVSREEIRNPAFFSAKVLPALQRATGLSKGELAEMVSDAALENLALLLSHDLSFLLKKKPKDIADDLIDLLTGEGDLSVEQAVEILLSGAGLDPIKALKNIDVSKRISDSRERAVADILEEYGEEETQEAADPKIRARIRILRDLERSKKRAEDYWKSGEHSETDYLSPEERSKEERLEKEIEKHGGVKAFNKWLQWKYPKIDWDQAEKRAEELERQEKAAFLKALQRAAQQLADKKSKQGKEPVEDAESMVSDEELDAFLQDNPAWAKIIEDDPSWRDKLKKNPDLLSELPEMDFGEAVSADPKEVVSEREKKLLSMLADRVRPGGLKLPAKFYIWRLAAERLGHPDPDTGEKRKEPNPKYSIRDFISSFFEQEGKIDDNRSLEDMIKYGTERPISKRRLADLTGFSSQTLTTSSKKLKERGGRITDPEAVMKYFEPRRSSKRKPGVKIANAPDWIIDAIEPILVTSDDFVKDVTDLAEKLIDWSWDPVARGAVEAELEKERAKGRQVDVDWGKENPGKAFAVALGMVVQNQAPKIAKDLIDAVDIALAKIDQDLRSNNDVEILTPAGEGPLDWNVAFKKYYDPQINRVLAAHGLSYTMGGNLINKLRKEVRPLVIKYMREESTGGKGLSIGQKLFTALIEKLEKILNSQEMLETLVGTGETGSGRQGQMQAPYMVKTSMRKSILEPQKARSSEKVAVGEARKKMPDTDDIDKKKSNLRVAKNLFKSRLRKLGSNPSVEDLRDWFKKLPKSKVGDKISAKDLVKLLTIVLD